MIEKISKEEIRKNVLESMRVELIEKQIRNELLLEISRNICKNEPQNMKIVKSVRNLENNAVMLESDINLIEKKLEQYN